MLEGEIMNISFKIRPAKNGKDYLFVKTPYHPEYPKIARQLGGLWQPITRRWAFDPRNEERVREAVVKIYGTDGTDVDLVTIRYQLTYKDYNKRSLYIAGRMVARRKYPGQRIEIGDGVIVINGEFHDRGRLLDGENVEIEMKDVPRLMAEKWVEKGCMIIDDISTKQKELEAEIVRLRRMKEEIELKLVFIDQQLEKIGYR